MICIISRRVRRRNTARLSICAALIGALTLVGIAPAFAFHEYAIGVESSSPNYTGIRVQRVDKSVTGLNNTGCSSYFDGQPLYQTEWIIASASSSANFIEIGTGHQCQDKKVYWYWAYSFEGHFSSRGTVDNVVLGDSHYFGAKKSVAGGGYTWEIDGTTRGSTTLGFSGEVDHVGLESYDGSAATKYTSKSLEYSYNIGGYNSWAGQDYVIPGMYMCGRFFSDTSFSHSENVSC